MTKRKKKVERPAPFPWRAHLLTGAFRLGLYEWKERKSAISQLIELTGGAPNIKAGSAFGAFRKRVGWAYAVLNATHSWNTMRAEGRNQETKDLSASQAKKIRDASRKLHGLLAATKGEDDGILLVELLCLANKMVYALKYLSSRGRRFDVDALLVNNLLQYWEAATGAQPICHPNSKTVAFLAACIDLAVRSSPLSTLFIANEKGKPNKGALAQRVRRYLDRAR